MGDRLPLERFRERLVHAGYAAVTEVQTQGEFAVRGALLDLFPMGSTAAYRIDLFDEDIETIRTFDPETQRSEGKVERIHLLPAREFPTDREGIEGFRRRYREALSGDPARSRIYSDVSKRVMPGGIEAYLPLFLTTPRAWPTTCPTPPSCSSPVIYANNSTATGSRLANVSSAIPAT